jgi:hypothetical protein
MRSNAAKKQESHGSVQAWFENKHPQRMLKIVERKQAPRQQKAAIAQDEMTSPDFEAFMAQYGRWSDFA